MDFSQERLRKEKAEAHLYRIIKVARDEDLVEQIGRHIYFDLVDHDKVRSFRIQKQIHFYLFKQEVAKEFGIPVQLQRFWLWAKRQNHTYRPNRPLTHLEETQTVGQLRWISDKVHNGALKLFLEVQRGLDLRPIAPPDKTNEDILLFFKLYDPAKEKLRYVGRLFVKSTVNPMEYLAKLNKMAGYDPDEEIELYEELRFEPNVICTPIEKKNTFRASQLIDGDIVCFQKSHTVESAEQYRYPNVPSFLDYVHNQQVVVHFRSLEKPKEDDFCLEMSKLFTYDVVVERVAQILNLDDPSKIRLTSHNSYSQQPKPQPIKYRGIDHLADMLIQHDQTSDILYYEVLDIPLPELESLKFLKVAFHHDMKGEVELSHPDAELRLLEVFYRKIYKNLEGIEKETPAGKKGAEEATSEVIMSLTRLGENFNRQVEQIGLQNILENPAAALELSKRLRSTGMKDLKNDLSDELMASVPSEVSVVRDKVVLYAFLKMLESRMSNLSAEVTLSSSKLAEAEAKLKSYESSEVDHNSRVESLEAEVIKKQAENETLKNQAVVSEQKACTSQQKAVFLEAELIRKQAENEALKNQAENEALKNQAIVSEQKASSFQQKALFLEAEVIKKQAENEALKNQAIASEQKASSSEQKAIFLEAELIRNEAENEVLKNQAIASEQKASRSEQKALLLARTILKRDKYSKDLSDAASKLIEDSSGSGESKDQGADPLPFPSSS